MKIAIYARVSTSNGQDPEMQLRELREYCERRGWEIAAAGVLWGALYLFTGSRLRSFPCPRCGKNFVGKVFFGDPGDKWNESEELNDHAGNDPSSTTLYLSHWLE